MAAAESGNRSLALRDLIDLIAPADQRSSDMDRAIALHEAGHAIVAHELGLPVAEISIIGTGGGVGGWVHTAQDDRLMTRDGVERLVAMMLAGRAADSVLGDGPHAGAASDIETVNALLRTAMLEFGLYDSLTTGPNTDLRNFGSPGTSFWNVVRTETDRALGRATEIIERRRSDVFKLIEALLAERVVTGDRLAEILKTDTRVPSHTDSDIGEADCSVRRP